MRRVDTRDLDHARVLAAEAARAGETVVALSGDGMIGAVADALREVPGAVLGVLPGGRGNDLARVLGIPEDPLEACAVIARGVERPLDLGEVGGRAFVGIASAGFDSDANRIANEAPARLGGLVYAYGALRALASWRPARFEIELDPPGERHGFTGFTASGPRTPRPTAAGCARRPDAMLDDGLLEVMVLESIGKLQVPDEDPAEGLQGHPRAAPTVRVFRAAEVEICADRPFTMYADGDPIGELPVRVRAVRGVVEVLVPADAAAAPGVPPHPRRPGSPTAAAGRPAS